MQMFNLWFTRGYWYNTHISVVDEYYSTEKCIVRLYYRMPYLSLRKRR